MGHLAAPEYLKVYYYSFSHPQAFWNTRVPTNIKKCASKKRKIQNGKLQKEIESTGQIFSKKLTCATFAESIKQPTPPNIHILNYTFIKY